MKKLLHISIIALFVIAPTFGWADPARDPSKPIIYEGFTVLTDAEYNALPSDEAKAAYNTALAEAERDLKPASGTPDSDGLYFGLKKINDGDGTNVATAQYVKGAFNQLTKRINRVYRKANEASDKDYEAIVNVCQDWDSDTCNGEADVTVFEKGTRPTSGTPEPTTEP